MDDAESFTKGLKQLLNAIFRMQAIEGHSESGRTSYFVISLFYLSFWVNFVLTFHLGSICICFAFVSSRFYMGKLQLVFQDLFNIKWYMLAWRVITLSWLFGIQLAFCFKLSFFFFFLLAALLICSQSAGWVHAVYVRAVFMVLLIESGACH